MSSVCYFQVQRKCSFEYQLLKGRGLVVLVLGFPEVDHSIVTILGSDAAWLMNSIIEEWCKFKYMHA